MSSVLRILIKDARHHWPLLVGWWAVMAGFSWLDARGPRSSSGLNLAGLLTLVSLASLIVWVIHEDELTGDRQDWLTRPISWQALLGAKMLFVLVFGNAAVVLAQAAVFLANGIPLGSYLGVCLSGQFLVTWGFLLPVTALASVTRNGKQTIAAVLGAYAAEFFLMAARIRYLTPTSLDFGSGDWVAVTVEVIVLGVVALSVLLLQYSRRSTLTARIILAAGLPLLMWIPQILPWGAVHAVTVRLSPHVDQGVAQLALRPRITNRSQPIINEIHFPLMVEALPEGSQATVEWAKAAIQAPDGALWQSGWSPTKLALEGKPFTWSVVVDHPFFAKYRDTPVHVKVTVALVLLGPVRSTRLPDAGVSSPVPGDGICLWVEGSSNIQGSCVKPFNRTMYAAFRYQSKEGREFSQSALRAPLPGPYPTAINFSIWAGAAAIHFLPLPPSRPFEVYLDSREVIGYVDRVLDLPRVLLSEDL